jgi:hypothetical protein
LAEAGDTDITLAVADGNGGNSHRHGKGTFRADVTNAVRPFAIPSEVSAAPVSSLSSVSQRFQGGQFHPQRGGQVGNKSISTGRC